MRKKLAILSVMIFILGVGVFYSWAKQPAVSTSTIAQSQVKAAVSEEFVDYTNEYVSMQIPKRFVVKPATIGNGRPLYFQQLLTVPLQNGGLFSDQLAVVVGKLPSGGLEEVSDVHLRSRSKEYVRIETLLSDTVAYESVHESSYEIAYFNHQNTKYISVVLTTSASSAQTAKEQAGRIMQSLQWLQ